MLIKRKTIHSIQKIFFLFLLALAGFDLPAQNNNIVFVPLAHENFSLTKRLERSVKKQGFTMDSLIIFLNKFIVEIMISEFPEVKIVSTNSNTIFNNCMETPVIKLRIMENSGNNRNVHPPKPKLEQRPSRMYYSWKLNEPCADQLRFRMIGDTSSYLVFITNFNCHKKYPFTVLTECELHYEIYNNAMKKISGNKSKAKFKMRRDVYYDTVKDLIRKSLRGFSKDFRKISFPG